MPIQEIFKEDFPNSKESRRLYQITDSCRKSDTGTTSWPGAWTARREYRGIHQAVQCKDSRPGRFNYSGSNYRICRQKFQLNHQDSAGSRAAEEGLQAETRFRNPQQGKGCHHFQGVHSEDRGDQDEGPERGEPGIRYEHDRRHRKKYGNHC